MGGVRKEAMNVAVEGQPRLEAPLTPAAYNPCQGESIRIGDGWQCLGGPQCSGSRLLGLVTWLWVLKNLFQEPMARVKTTW